MWLGYGPRGSEMKTDELERECENTSFCFGDNKTSSKEWSVVWWHHQLLTFPAQSWNRNRSVWTLSETWLNTVISSKTVSTTNHWPGTYSAWFLSECFFTYVFRWHSRIWVSEDDSLSSLFETPRQPQTGINSSRALTMATSNSLRDCEDFITEQTFAMFYAGWLAAILLFSQFFPGSIAKRCQFTVFALQVF